MAARSVLGLSVAHPLRSMLKPSHPVLASDAPAAPQGSVRTLAFTMEVHADGETIARISGVEPRHATPLLATLVRGVDQVAEDHRIESTERARFARPKPTAPPPPSAEELEPFAAAWLEAVDTAEARRRALGAFAAETVPGTCEPEERAHDEEDSEDVIDASYEEDPDAWGEDADPVDDRGDAEDGQGEGGDSVEDGGLPG